MNSNSGETDWQLIYWPGFCGRGEFVRLVFEEAGIKYVENNDAEYIYKYFKCHENEMDGFPMLSPPIIKDRKTGFQLCQTPVICKYLGKRYGLYPDNEADEFHADQVNATIHDYIGEGRLSFHGISPNETYEIQKEESKPYIARFEKERIPRYMNHFELLLKHNDGGNGYLFGSKLTYVDLGLYHILRATEFQFPQSWTNILPTIPLLKAFKERIENRPNIKSYLNSDRLKPFCGDSMM
ncbi:glutathione S-transferase-like [Clytia hemisphaerica]|uniref:Glutathione S-transferase n=1 Tax=Clytia hemisphaerica TaxID=252671 RepID=A0A7M5UY95_9CNID